MPEMTGWRFIALVLGIVAALLFIASVAVFEGFIPASFVNNFTAPELGTFGVLTAAGAIACEIAGQRHKPRRD